MSSVTLSSVPRFTRGYRLQHDTVRQQWIIQAPERALIADPIAATILRYVDNTRSVDVIVDALCQSFDASRETITHDVLALLSDLVEKGILRL